MNTFLVFACLLVAAAAKPMDDGVIAVYMSHILPYLEPCASEQKLTDDEFHNVQQVGMTADAMKLACLRSCVMKKMNALDGTTIIKEPIYELIEKVHNGKDDEIATMKNLVGTCSNEAAGETDECQLAQKFVDCYIQNMFN